MSLGRVYFAHGKESGPWGTKITALASVADTVGFEVQSPDYSGIEDPDARVRQLLGAASGSPRPLILVGSSMGAYVSVVASQTLRPAGLFLLAPAVYIPGFGAHQDPQPLAAEVSVVHAWNDEVVPVANAIRFAQRHNAALHIFDSDHRLKSVLPRIQELFSIFLAQVRRSAS